MLCLILVRLFGTKLDTTKRSNNFNTFKHYLKKYFSKDFKNCNSSFLISVQCLTTNILVFTEQHDSFWLRDRNVQSFN